MAKLKPLTDLERKAMTALARVHNKDFELTEGRETPFPKTEDLILSKEELAYSLIAVNSKTVKQNNLEEWARL